eukprot:5355543-Ditylum_brightwellii.AAC.1
MTITESKAHSCSDMILMTNHSAELRQRYTLAHDENFKNIPGAQLLAMMVNPLLAIHGFDE